MPDAPDPTDLPPWELRYRAARVSLPEWARDRPERCLYVGNASGTFELYAWDRATGQHRQVTDRAEGTHTGTLDPAGTWIWWFDDTDGDEFGVWRRQPFAGGPDEEAAPGLAAAYPAGLALAREGWAVVGSSDDDGTTIVRTGSDSDSDLDSDSDSATLYASEHDAHVGDLSHDDLLVAISHSEHGDSRHPALRVLDLTGAAVADLWDGPGKGLEVLGFAPVAGDPRLLIGHERHGRPEIALWDTATGAVSELALDLPGEVEAEWFPDASSLLVEHAHAARSELYRYDLASGQLEAVPTPRGLVSEATPRPDGSVEYAWSDAASPEVVRSTDGGIVLAPPGPPAPASVPVEDVWADGPGGRVHALLSRPAGAQERLPAVFLVHGGPTWHDSDAFASDVAAWVDHGYAAIRVNYRGSTGYGSSWRDAIEARIGHVELEDVAAVRAALVADGTIDPSATVLAGGSWGGFLTLLGLGTQPELWAAGIAAVPVADYVAAYEDEMEGLKAFDRSLFGGSPAEVPSAYEDSSPITYVERVRAPVLVLAGANDPRCPLRQIENYLTRLDGLGREHEVYRFDAGHGSLVTEERIRQMRTELDFALRHVPTGASVA